MVMREKYLYQLHKAIREIAQHEVAIVILNNATTAFNEESNTNTIMAPGDKIKALMGDYWTNCVSERFKISKGKSFGSDNLRNLKCEFSYRMEPDTKVKFKIEDFGILGVDNS